MKLKAARLRRNSGSVLAVTLFTTFLAGVTLASFLALTQHQMFANARSQSWNRSMAVTESGVEDAMQLINKYSHDPEKLLEWATSPSVTEDKWYAYNSSNTFYTVRWSGSDDLRSVYVVFIDNSYPNRPVITSYGLDRFDHQYAHKWVTSASAGLVANGFQSTYIDRGVRVATRRYARWAMAMLADREIDLNGNVVTTDSFDSSDPSKSDFGWKTNATYGVYDSGSAGDEGDVATNMRIIDSLNAGNAKIRGHASTGPGGTVGLGPLGSIGSDAWVSGSNKGIQPGYANDDMNVLLDSVEEPDIGWFSLPSFGGHGTNINGITYDHVLLTSGDYKASTLKGSVYIGPGVDARILITGDVRMTASDQIYLDEAAEGLTIYMAGSQFNLGGNGVVNETGLAANFQYIGLETNTKLTFQGNADFIGAIYAPNADFVLGGGGRTVYDFIGASVTRTVTMNGSYNFHYDEDLANVGPSRGFIPTRWGEVKMNGFHPL